MKRIKGFTVMEVIITIFIMAMISIPLYFVLEDSNKQANLVMARDNIKQEANKVFKILENDLTQARKGTYKEEKDGFVIKVRKDAKHDVDLRYSFNDSKLHRTYEKKSWLISNQVNELEITKAIDGTPGKMSVHLVMKSNLPGIKPSEQPIYEQQKIIVLMEDATEENDPYWREVGDIDSFFKTEGNLLAGIKEDATKMVQDFSAIWSKALGDVKSMTVGELKQVMKDLQNNLKEVETNLKDINQQIKDLEWEALYDRSGFIGGLFGANKRKRKSADKIKALVSGYKSKEEMSWEQVKNTARSDMKEDAIKAMFDSKVQLFDGQKQIQENIKSVEDQLKSME